MEVAELMLMRTYIILIASLLYRLPISLITRQSVWQMTMSVSVLYFGYMRDVDNEIRCTLSDHRLVNEAAVTCDALVHSSVSRVLVLI